MKSIFESTYRKIKRSILCESSTDDDAYMEKSLKEITTDFPELKIGDKSYVACTVTFRVFNDYSEESDPEMARKEAAPFLEDAENLSLDVVGAIQKAEGKDDEGKVVDFTKELEDGLHKGSGDEQPWKVLTDKAKELIEAKDPAVKLVEK